MKFEYFSSKKVDGFLLEKCDYLISIIIRNVIFVSYFHLRRLFKIATIPHIMFIEE